VRRRVLVSTLLVIAATVLTLGVPLGFVSWRVVDDLVHRDLTSRLGTISSTITEQSLGNAQNPLDLQRLEAAVPSGGRLDIRMAGRIDQSVGPEIAGDAVSEQLVMTGGGQLRLSLPIAELRRDQLLALLLVALAVALSVVVGTGVALLTAGRLVTPLTDLARRAARLGAGDFRSDPQRTGIPELDRVAQVLDDSAEDIKVLLGRERELAGDISHQLRTRLTGLRLRLEELSTHPDPLVVEEVSEALEQTDRLVTVVDDLLANARSQRAGGARELDLEAALEDLDAEWRPRLTAAGRELAVHCPPGIRVRATAVRLREALGVLLDNALRHGSGAVTVQARAASATGSMVVVEVADEGAGVPDALTPHVFDRGISTAASTGIGLGLARAFVEADGGRLELRRAAPPVFALFLPQREVGEAASPGEPSTGTASDPTVGEVEDVEDVEDVGDVAPAVGDPAAEGDGVGAVGGTTGEVVPERSGSSGAPTAASIASSSSGNTNRR
jgi:signal transduction histidine kinase